MLGVAWAVVACGAALDEQDRQSAVRAREFLLHQRRPDSPGCAVAVHRNGIALFEDAFGMADLERREALTPEHAFVVASMSKQFTAAALAVAAEEGWLSLRDALREHIPELADHGRPITLWDAIHHTSGLRDDGVLIDLTGQPSAYRSRGEIIRLLARQRGLNFEPGTRFLYGNTGYMLIPEVLERATGIPFADFARTRLFEPLGMRRTHYQQRGVVDEGLVTPYVWREGKWAATPPQVHLARIGNGGLVTTLQDFNRWAHELLAEGDRLRGGARLMRELKQPAVLADGTSTPYAFGLRLSEFRGWATLGHGGSGEGFKTHSMLFPATGLVVAGFCNNGVYAQPLVMSLAELFLPVRPDPRDGERLPGKSGTQSDGRSAAAAHRGFAEYAGTYREPELGWPLIVTAQKDGLLILGDAIPYRFRATAPDGFEADGELRIVFERDGAGRVVRLRQLGERRYGTGGFERIAVVAPAPAALREYAGRFFSVELGAAYEIEPGVIGSDAGGLLARNVSAEPAEKREIHLRPLLKDEFASTDDRMVFRFDRDDTGEIRGLRLTAQFGWVRDVAFERSRSAALSWARQAARPLSIEAADDTFDASLGPLRERLAHARVIALGEANHNGHEFLELRNRLFRHLVQQHGVTAIAAETDYLESIAVDDYVLGRAVPHEPPVHGVMSWSYGTFHENRELIDWMRTYNANRAGARKIRFYGLEARGDFGYDGRPILEVLIEYLARVDPPLARSYSRRFASWQSGFSVSRYRSLPAVARSALVVDLQDLVTDFERRQVIWTQLTSQLEYQRACRLAVVARQLATDLKTAGAGRDVASFDNLRWALEREGPEGRIFLFMHDMHVSRWRKYAPPDHPLYSSIGEHAADLLGDRYVAIGTFHEGGETRNWLALPGFDNCLVRLGPSKPGSLNEFLSEVGPERYLLDLTALPPAGAALDWFEAEHPSRNINVRSGYSVMRPAAAFDAMVFVRDIAPLHALDEGAPSCKVPRQQAPVPRDRAWK